MVKNDEAKRKGKGPESVGARRDNERERCSNGCTHRAADEADKIGKEESIKMSRVRNARKRGSRLVDAAKESGIPVDALVVRQVAHLYRYVR